MSKIKEFEELDSATEYAYEYCVNRNNSNNSHEFKIHMYEAIERAKKDAWNAAIKWASQNANCTYNDYEDFLNGKETYIVDKQSILNGLID